jgi:hypothetical protein
MPLRIELRARAVRHAYRCGRRIVGFHFDAIPRALESVKPGKKKKDLCILCGNKTTMIHSEEPVLIPRVHLILFDP